MVLPRDFPGVLSGTFVERKSGVEEPVNNNSSCFETAHLSWWEKAFPVILIASNVLQIKSKTAYCSCKAACSGNFPCIRAGLVVNRNLFNMICVGSAFKDSENSSRIVVLFTCLHLFWSRSRPISRPATTATGVWLYFCWQCFRLL